MTEEVKLRESLLLLIKVAAARVSLDPLESILENAELVGSRGRARKYGRPEPEGRDHDYAVFSDDSEEQDRYLKLLRQLGGAGYKLRDRPGGFLTASGNNTDLSIYPTSKRDSIHEAWELMEGGMSKEDAWEHVNKQAEDEENWYVAASKKAGKGLFAEKDFEVGEEVFHAGDKDGNESGTDDWEMTEASMATNHDRDPNARVVKDGDTLSVVADKPIKGDDEVFVSYFQVSHAIGPGSRLMHNGQPVRTRSTDEVEKWASQERVDWVGLVHGNA